MKLRLVLSTATVAAFLLHPGESVAQTVGSADSFFQDIKTEGLPPLPPSSGQFIELLPCPPPSQASPAPPRSGKSEQSDREARLAQPSGDIRMQYARIYFEQMSHERRHWKERVEITLRDGTRLPGRIVSVETDRFTMQIHSTKQETSVNFSDLSSWQLAPPNEHIALNLLAVAGLELLEIARLPLIILATLSGQCGC